VLESLTMFSKRECGFTLIELMVVVALAAIVLALAAPSFSGLLERRRLEGAAAELGTDIQYARSEAVQRNRNVFLETGGGGSCYAIATWVSGTGSCDCAAGTCTPDPTLGGPRNLKFVRLPAGTSIGNGVFLDFEPVRGSLQGAVADAEISIASGALALRADVQRNGRVSICAPTGSTIKGYPSC
jgi:type IV fimbrial biogenesis protein FimT